MNNEPLKLDSQPKDISSFSEKILKKYNLEKKQEEIFNSAIAMATENPKESERLFGELPSSKIIKVIEKIYKQEITERDLPEILKSELEIDSKVAKEIAREINMEGLEIYKALVRKKITPEVEEKMPPEKITLKREITPQRVSLERPITPPKESKEPPSFTTTPEKDLYREMPSEEELRPKF